MSGGRYVAALALGSFASAGLAIGAIATPAWHIIDAAEHISIGIFQTCNIVDGLDSSTTCDTVHFPSEFCGNERFTYQMRHAFTAVMGILAALMGIGCGILGLTGYVRQRKLHPKAMMTLSVLSAFFMTICISIFSHTYDGWLYCGYGYCTYAQHYLGLLHTCRASYGYSYVMAASSLGFSIVASMSCGLYVRFLRCGYLDEHGNVLAKVIAAKQTFLSKLRQEQTQESTRLQREESAMRYRANAARSLPPDDSQSPERPGYLFTNHSAPGNHTPTRASQGRSAVSATPQQVRFASQGRSQQNNGSGFASPDGHPASLATPASPNVPQDNANSSNAHLPGKIGVDESWVLDASSGMYWSEREQLYLKATGHQLFFDPASSMWYDPNTEQWTLEQPDMD